MRPNFMLSVAAPAAQRLAAGTGASLERMQCAQRIGEAPIQHTLAPMRGFMAVGDDIWTPPGALDPDLRKQLN
jgi:hypothetical protein